MTSPSCAESSLTTPTDREDCRSSNGCKHVQEKIVVVIICRNDLAALRSVSGAVDTLGIVVFRVLVLVVLFEGIILRSADFNS